MDPVLSNRTLNNQLYRNWVTSSTALKFFTDGLHGFVESEFTDFHTSVVKQVESELKPLNILPNDCGQCTVQNLLPCKPRDRCKARPRRFLEVHSGSDDQNKPAKCPKQICGKLLNLIKNNHKWKNPTWQNTTAQKWVSDYIEIAKCFLPFSEHNMKVTSVKDVDTIGLLDMIENYTSTSLTQAGKSEKIRKCKAVRHNLFHTNSFDVEDAKMKEFINDLIDLLSDEKKICSDCDARQAVTRLKELAAGHVKVTMEHELEVRKEALNEVQLEKTNAEANKENRQAEMENLTTVLNGVEKYRYDVEEQYKSMVPMATMQQDYQAMRSEYSLQMNSLANIQGEIKINLTKMSEKTDGNVKEMIDETLQEITRDEVFFEQSEKTQSHLQHLEERVNKLENSMDDVKASVRKLEEKIEGLEKLEQLHKDDIFVLSDYFRRKSDLQVMLCNRYTKKFSKVSVPFNSEISVDVDKVHTKQIIQSTDLRGSITDSQLSSNLNSYKDLLSKEGNLSKKVVLLGNIGHGKSLYFYKLLQTWISALQKIKSQEAGELSGDEDFLSQFSLVFYIDLESISDCSYVFEMISNQIFNVPLMMLKDGRHDEYVTILEVFKKEPKKCLIILDSLDKWGHKPGVKHLPTQEFTDNCVTLIGSRPWKWNDISYTDHVGHDVDSVFEIFELEEERLTVGHILCVFCKETMPQKDKTDMLGEFDRLSSEPAIKEITKVPKILHYLIWSLFRTDCLYESRTDFYCRMVEFLFDYTHSWHGAVMSDSQDSRAHQSYLQALNLPKHFTSSEHINHYYDVISKIACLAFNGLMRTRHSDTLVLNTSEIDKYFQRKELELALKTGLLTKVRIQGATLEKTSQVSFILPTLQHFFAALHLALSAWDYNVVEELVDFCSSVDRIYRMENLLQFAFCMIPHLRSRFTRGVCENLSPELCSRQSHNRLKYFLMKCMKEVDMYNKNEPQTTCMFYIDSLELSVDDFTSSQVVTTLKLYQSNAGNLRHLATITEVSDTYPEEQLEQISRYIFKYLQCATCLVKLHLTCIVLEDGAALAFTYMKSLEHMHLEKITNKKREVINLTYCCNLKVVKCQSLMDMEITTASSFLTMFLLTDCTSIHLKVGPGPNMRIPINFGYFQNDELRKLESIVCSHSNKCVLDLQDVYVTLGELVMEACSDCDVMIDQNRMVEEDLLSSTVSSLSDYIPDFTKITTYLSDPSPCILSYIQRLKVTKGCRRVKVNGFAIVTDCRVYECVDSDFLFKSNIKDKKTFFEMAEEVNQRQCLERVEIKNASRAQGRNYFKFMNTPLHLQSIHISDSLEFNFEIDGFDVSVAMATAEAFFTENMTAVDAQHAERSFLIHRVKDCDILVNNTSVVFTNVAMECCQTCRVSINENPVDVAVSDKPDPDTNSISVVGELRCAQVSSDSLLEGLHKASVRRVRLEWCELPLMGILWGKVESLYIEKVPQSLALEIFKSLTGSPSLLSLVYKQIPSEIISDFQSNLPKWSCMKSLDISLHCSSRASMATEITTSQGAVAQMSTDTSTSSSPRDVAGIHEFGGSLGIGTELTSLSCGYVDVESLHQMTNLKNLTLDGMKGHTISHVIETLPSFRHLKELTCFHFSKSMLLFLQTLAKKMPALEKFMLSSCEFDEENKGVLVCVSRMPKLKQLACFNIPGCALNVLQKQQLKNLETFEAGRFMDKLHQDDLCFLHKRPCLKTIICNGLTSCDLKMFLTTIASLDHAVDLELRNINRVESKVMDSLRCIEKLNGVKLKGMTTCCVADILSNLPDTPLQNVYMEEIDLPQGQITLVTIEHSPLQISELKLHKITHEAMTDLMGIFEIAVDVKSLELSHVELDSVVIGCMQRLKTVRDFSLKLRHIHPCHVTLLGECVGKLHVKHLTISHMSFHGPKLDLSTAYGLSYIKLDTVYMHPKAWLYFFTHLPKLRPERESGIISGFVLVDHAERNHTTYVTKIILQNCCVTKETIDKVVELDQFPHAEWKCVKIAGPSLYNSLQRFIKEKTS